MASYLCSTMLTAFPSTRLGLIINTSGSGRDVHNTILHCTEFNGVDLNAWIIYYAPMVLKCSARRSGSSHYGEDVVSGGAGVNSGYLYLL